MKAGRRRTSWMVAAAVVAAGLMAAGPVAAETQELEILPSSSIKVDVPAGIKRLYISNPAILDAKPEADGLSVLVTGLRPGRAELRIARLQGDDVVYRVEVTPEQKELADEVRVLLADVEGVEVKVVGENVVLTGELLTQGDANKVAEVTRAFSGRVVNLTSLDLTGYERNVQRALQREIGLDTVEVRVEGGRVTVMGTVPSARDLERVKEIVKKRSSEAVVLLRVRAPRAARR